MRDGADSGAGMLGEKMCGSALPASIQSTGNTLMVQFHSDYSVVSTGFEISVHEGKYCKKNCSHCHVRFAEDSTESRIYIKYHFLKM